MNPLLTWIERRQYPLTLTHSALELVSGRGATGAPYVFWNAVVSLLGIAFAVWLASEHLPEIREFLHHVPDLLRDFVHAMRDLATR